VFFLTYVVDIGKSDLFSNEVQRGGNEKSSWERGKSSWGECRSIAAMHELLWL